jgi:hypothetical protein
VFAFSWSIADDDPRTGIHDRFRMLSDLVVRSFGRLGVSAQVGELPGEYCPGAFSVHAGPIKLMGVGQRVAKRAAHIGGVIVVSGSRLIRSALIPVYDALGLAWEPGTAGAIQDVAPEVTLQATADAILAEATITLARRLAPEHIPA